MGKSFGLLPARPMYQSGYGSCMLVMSYKRLVTLCTHAFNWASFVATTHPAPWPIGCVADLDPTASLPVGHAMPLSSHRIAVTSACMAKVPMLWHMALLIPSIAGYANVCRFLMHAEWVLAMRSCLFEWFAHYFAMPVEVPQQHRRLAIALIFGSKYFVYLPVMQGLLVFKS